jgi:transcriptional regulator with XRE-family HTH domain
LEEPTPRQKLIKEIQEATGRSEAAVRSWIIGRSKPEPVIIKLIAERLNVDEDYLFPDEELAKVSSDD